MVKGAVLSLTIPSWCELEEAAPGARFQGLLAALSRVGIGTWYFVQYRVNIYWAPTTCQTPC